LVASAPPSGHVDLKDAALTQTAVDRP